MSDQLLTIKEVADILRVDRTTVNRYIEQGRLQTIVLGKGKKAAKRIKQAEFDRFLEEAEGKEP